MATVAFKAEGEAIYVIGETADGSLGGHLGQSLYLREIHAREDGPPPPVDLAKERAHGDAVRALVAEGKVTAVHDISDGGLLVAVAEMALAGNIGATLEGISNAATAFGEDQARYIVTTSDAAALEAAGVPITRIGTTGGNAVKVNGAEASLTELRKAHEGFFPALMEA
jgi:phosphoribosylformylglycinamidine synthase